MADETAQIEEIAVLMHQVDRFNRPGDVAELDRRLGALDHIGSALVIFTGKMLQGKPFRIMSDNPDTITRYRSMAQHLGAVERDGLLFVPPALQ